MCAKHRKTAFEGSKGSYESIAIAIKHLNKKKPIRYAVTRKQIGLMF
jgi:hypothetical protein